MLRVFTYLVALLKLLLIGKWYPPAHVRDVSAQEFADWQNCVSALYGRLEVIERTVEATRKKVYREEVKTKEGEEAVIVAPSPAAQEAPAPSTLAGLQAGDEVPPGYNL